MVSGHKVLNSYYAFNMQIKIPLEKWMDLDKITTGKSWSESKLFIVFYLWMFLWNYHVWIHSNRKLWLKLFFLMKIIFSFTLSFGCREKWDPCVQVPSMESQGQDHKGGGRGLQVRGCWAKRASLLHTVHPHGCNWEPQAWFHHLPPVHPSQAQRSLCYQLVRFFFLNNQDGPISLACSPSFSRRWSRNQICLNSSEVLIDGYCGTNSP